MIVKIDHVAIAVDKLEASLPFWAEALGLEVGGIETVASEGVKIAWLAVGNAHVELLEPTKASSPVGRYLKSRGAGLHHVTLAVSDLEPLLDTLRERGVTIVGGTSRRGGGGRNVAFLHPKSTGGVLVELVEAEGLRARQPAMLEPGSAALLYLRDPQEKLWGVLRRLDPTGVVIEGIDLSSFDDWVAQVERDEETVVGPSVLFIPMARVEKMLLDRSSGGLPSLAERFQRRVGRPVQEVLGDDSTAD
jgi:methylmalonyl-CoA/ethylmalonyl-CoA epimerase